MLPFCSIILPAFNEAQDIEACLASLQQQTYPRDRFEIIVIDNGSSDATTSIAQRFADHVEVRPGIKVGAVRNVGARHATGEILVFIDSDCIVDRDWLCRGVKLLTGTRNGVIGGALKAREDATWIERYWLLKGNRPQQDDLMGSCICIYSEDFSTIGGFNEQLTSSEDTDLSLRLKAAGYNIQMRNEMAVVHLGNPATIADFATRQIWHAENYLQQPQGLKEDKVFWLVCLQLALVLACIPAGFLYGWLAMLWLLPLLCAAPLALSFKRMMRVRYKPRQIFELLPIFLLDQIYLGARIIGLLKSLLTMFIREQEK